MPSQSQIESVACPRCHAGPGVRCDFRESHPGGGKHKPYHLARAKALEASQNPLHDEDAEVALAAGLADGAHLRGDGVSDFPRRGQRDKWSSGEHYIQHAIDAVEEMGADVLLTEAVILLGKAKDKVADWIDKGNKPA